MLEHMKKPVNKKKLAIIISCSIVGALALAVAIPFTIFGIRSAAIKKDYFYLRTHPT